MSAPNVGWYRLVATRDERAEDVAQVFLGTRIGCARCHDHPTDRWTRADHAGFAAIFARVGTKQGADPASFRVFHRPGRPDPAAPAPRPLGGEPFPADDHADPRDALVARMVAPDHPQFARAAVNRYWAHFFGRGLVEPLDDFRVSNPPSHPELLDELAEGFRASEFRLKWLARTIATSATYARSSRPAEPTAGPTAAPGTYARFAPRRLPAEVLLDAIDRVAGTTTRFGGVPPCTRAVELPDDGFASPFLDAFGRPERRTACECERDHGGEPDLMQALFLVSSAELEARVGSPTGRAARYARAAITDAATDRDQVAEVYRVALSRPPMADEAVRAVSFLAARRESGRLAAGYEDLIWALINSKEFLFNH